MARQAPGEAEGATSAQRSCRRPRRTVTPPQAPSTARTRHTEGKWAPARRPVGAVEPRHAVRRGSTPRPETSAGPGRSRARQWQRPEQRTRGWHGRTRAPRRGPTRRGARQKGRQRRGPQRDGEGEDPERPSQKPVGLMGGDVEGLGDEPDPGSVEKTSPTTRARPVAGKPAATRARIRSRAGRPLP